jgi:hypothetical protein
MALPDCRDQLDRLQAENEALKRRIERLEAMLGEGIGEPSDPDPDPDPDPSGSEAAGD